MHLQSNLFPLLGECAIHVNIIIMCIWIENKRPRTEFNAEKQQNLIFLWGSLLKSIYFHMLDNNLTISESAEILLKYRFLSHPQEKKKWSENENKIATKQ